MVLRYQRNDGIDFEAADVELPYDACFERQSRRNENAEQLMEQPYPVVRERTNYQENRYQQKTRKGGAR